MTTNDIDAIRARANAAEDGPWRVVEEHGRDIADEAYTRLTIQTDGPGRSREIAELVDPEHSWSSQLPEENAAFIAFARTLVPALCDEIEQLRAERDDLRAITEAAFHYVNCPDDVAATGEPWDALVHAVRAAERARTQETHQ